MSSDIAPDLDDLAAWVRQHIGPMGGPQSICPADLQRWYRLLTFNRACALLEALEARGILERVGGERRADLARPLAWKLASAPPRPGKGYSLPLSQAEHGALLRLLDERLRIERNYARVTTEQGKADIKTFRAVRSRLLGKEKP